MISAFFLFMTLVSFAFGIDPQEGNGGNICVQNVAWRSWPSIYRTLDELTDPDMASRLSMLDKKEPLQLIWDENSGFHTANLTSTKAGRIAHKHLRRYSESHRELGRELEAFFMLLDKVYVADRVFQAVGADFRTSLNCREGTAEAAIRTDIYGSTVLSSQAWEKLMVQSQVILLLHETVRMAQMYSTWAALMSNLKLQSFTMYLYVNRDRSSMSFRHEDLLGWEKSKLKRMTKSRLHSEILKMNQELDLLLKKGHFSQYIRTSQKTALMEQTLAEKTKKNKGVVPFKVKMNTLRADPGYREFVGLYLPTDILDY